MIFNLAGQVSHIDSMHDPSRIWRSTHAASFPSWRHAATKTRREVVCGTRQQYGKPQYLPLDEQHLQNPTDVNGVNKLAGEWYHIVYHNAYGLRTSSLRLTNTYGPAS